MTNEQRLYVWHQGALLAEVLSKFDRTAEGYLTCFVSVHIPVEAEYLELSDLPAGGHRLKVLNGGTQFHNGQFVFRFAETAYGP